MKTKATALRVRTILLILGILVAAICAVVFFRVDSPAGLSNRNTGDIFNALSQYAGTVFKSKTLTIGGDHALIQIK